MSYRPALSLISAFALSFLLNGSAMAVPISIAPDGDTIQGGGSSIPFGPRRGFPSAFGDTTMQQVVNASAFSALTGPSLLTSLDFISAFDTDPYGQLLGATLSIGVTPVSTTTLTENQATNAPNGVTLAASDYSLVVSGPGTYNVHLVLDTPFLYDPADGNLILQFFTPGTYGMTVRSFYPATNSLYAFSTQNRGDYVGTDIAILIQYNFEDGPAAPELNAAHCLPAFTFVGLLCLAGRRRGESGKTLS